MEQATFGGRLGAPPVPDDDLRTFARTVGVHPAIVVGRMLYEEDRLYKRGWAKKLESFDYADA